MVWRVNYSMADDVNERLKKIKLLAMDFDGVLTDNKVFVDENGIEMVICDRSDSLGIDLLKKKGTIDIIVISKETNKVVQQRCNKLKIECISGINDKLATLKNALKEKNMTLEDVAFIGNDVNDIECIQESGVGVAVSDSAPEVLQIADIVTKNKGGNGAVREFIEMLLMNQVKEIKS